MDQFNTYKERLDVCETAVEFQALAQEFLQESEGDPTWLHKWQRITEAYGKQGYLNESIYLASHLLSRQFEPKLFGKLINQLMALGLSAQALKLFNDYAAEVSGNLTLSLLKAKLMVEVNQIQAAIDLYKHLIEEYPLDERPYIDLADLYWLIEQWPRAEYYYQVVMDYFASKLDLRMVRNRLVEIELAKEITDFDRIESLFHHEGLSILTAEEHYLYALAQMQAHRYEPAIKLALQCIELDSDNLDCHFLLLDLYEVCQNQVALRQELSWLTETIPPYHESFIELAEIAKRNQIFLTTLARKLHEIFPLCENSDDQWLILNYLVNSKSANQSDSFGLKENELQTMLEMADFDEAYQAYILGKFYLSTTNIEKAIEQLALALQGSVNEETLVLDYVKALLQLGEEAQAKKLSHDYRQTYYDVAELKEIRHQINQ
ncbi:hypothetical protein [Vaginisenegalia massiliensis]|uniref:hypothetical protein n=1 Tax=Vaginisenegalia massiliensis TaxID=2058294 RepID=UPI000F5276BC|nr:hypothetical protein [Vaginisenegalia massiliensis]